MQEYLTGQLNILCAIEGVFTLIFQQKYRILFYK